MAQYNIKKKQIFILIHVQIDVIIVVLNQSHATKKEMFLVDIYYWLATDTEETAMLVTNIFYNVTSMLN